MQKKFETRYLISYNKSPLAIMSKIGDINDMEEQLEKDEAALQAELPKLKAEAGKYALVFEQKLIGTFATYPEALTKGYEIAGIKPFLVEQISDLPQVQQFSRNVGFEECLTSL